jgi:hypothetical protein
MRMKTKVLATLLVGLIVRIELASFAGHPGDLALFAYSARLYYESGRFDYLFPTLPLVYYVQLAFYSLYILLRDSGFSDLVFISHTNYMVEGLFFRIPLILSDLGIFVLILRFTSKLRYAALYLLNPLVIYLTGAWGTYDSLMMLPLVYGFVLLAKNERRLASLSFILAGLFKLFGFVPLGLLAVDNLVHRRWKEFGFQLGAAVGLTSLSFAPYLGTGLQDFYVGFVLRFLGLSGASTRAYDVFAIFSGARFTGSSPLIWLGVGAIAILFVLHLRKSKSTLQPVLLWSLVAAVALNAFSQSEPQWLSWVVPLSILYAYLTKRTGLAYYSYFFGIATTFLSITILQSVGYLVLGTPLVFFNAIEAFPGSVAVYAITISSMLLVLLGYVFLKPVRFKVEIVALVCLVYLQAYFWLSIMRILPV